MSRSVLPPVHEVQLANGFRALLVARRNLPVVASMLWYRVGSRDERTGETGLSHFLEHMMFKGTSRYAKGEIDLLTAKMGGSNNAFTDNDVTAYHFSLAADRWETALEIESSRMRGCLLDEAEFEAEKSVVLEELAMGEDDPWSMLYQATEGLTYEVHPYHHPVIGWRQDLERLAADGMKDYYERHYGPDRSTLVVFGDIDVAKTEHRIEKLFAPIPKAREQRRTVLAEPKARGERRSTLYFPGEITRMAFAFRTCRMGERQDFALDVLSSVLGSGRSSRLQQRLVLEEQVVTSVSVHNETRLDPGLFWIVCEVVPGAKPETVEGLVREEIDRLMQKSITAAEIKRCRIQLKASFLFEDETVLDAAMKIGRFDSLAEKGYRLLNNVPEIFDAITPQEVRQVAREIFEPKGWNVSWSLPADVVGQNGSVVR